MIYIKIIHIVAMVAWFAGLFYIWRLFVYHSMSDNDDTKKTFIIMEDKLYKMIMQPAMVVTIICGILITILFWDLYYNTYWLWIKFLLVLILIYIHFLSNYYRKMLAKGISYNHKIFRKLNEVPTIILILIIYLVEAKPF